LAGENQKIRVVWICHFSTKEIQTHLRLWKETNEFASWIANTILGFEKYNEIDLHIVAPHLYLKCDTHFVLRNINYYFLSFGFPVINRFWPSFFPIDAICGYPYLTQKIERVVKKISPDVINLQGAENPYYSSSILKFKDKFPCIITIQGFAAHLQDKSSIINKRRIKNERKILESFKYFFLDYDAIKVVKEYSPNMVGKVIWWPAAEVIIDSLPKIEFEKKTYDILYCGRMEQSKGIEDFIKVLAILKRNNDKVKAAIIGDIHPVYFKELKELCRQLSCHENVDFLGFLPTQKEIFEYFLASKLLLVPTLVDRYPSTIREAMRLKVPVIAYRTGNIPWTNNTRENIVLIDHANVIQMASEAEALLIDNAKQKRLANSARQFYEDEFSCDKNIERFIFGYKDVIQDFNS
jgi:glycosyltransferase involved in cell wall biosynthesis